MAAIRTDQRPTARRRGICTVGPGIWAAVLAGGAISLYAFQPGSAIAEPPAFPPAEQAAAPTRIDDSARRCEQCHVYEPSMTHPVGVRPSMKVPRGLPLDQGRMACTTCHTDDHQHDGRGSLRQMSNGAAFCAGCHEVSATSRASAHAAAVGVAHLSSRVSSHARADAPQRAPQARYRTVGIGGINLDSESTSCVGCHDGTAASDAGSHRTLSGTSAEPYLEHPVGVLYSGKAPARSEVRLVPEARLDHRVRLFDEQVGCGSCHSVYSRGESLLVMSNLRSQLCLSCHAQ